MRDSAVLFDVTKCVGCGSCTVACKMWNGLPYEENAHGYDVKLDDKTWTVVEYRDVKKGKEEALRFVKHQCMHCLEPSCVAVCFAKAITVSDEGAVVYDAKKCVGCRYCMIGCPYSVPKYEWDKVFPSVMKCRLCAEKLAKDESPACTSVCPSGALTFGSREELLTEAWSRIKSDSGYIQQVYGETEGGGTRWLYISDVPFKELGLPEDIPTKSIPATLHDYTKWKPGIFVGAAAVFGALGLYTKRRVKIENEQRQREGGEDDV
jgi:formate dehydrogenase iron-sulfur subunit